MSNYRSDVEEKEKLVVEYLNDIGAPIRRSSYLSGSIANQIASEYDGDVQSAHHIGNSYDSIGDTKLVVDEESNYIELKILGNKPSNFGTLANISPTVPIESGMLAGEPMKWKGFLADKNHTDTVLGILEKFPKYPNCVEDKCTTDLNTKKHKGRYIRDFVSDKTTKDFDPEVAEKINPCYTVEDLREVATQIKTEIEEFDRKIKIEYIKYLSEFTVRSSKVKAYTIIMVAGYHKKNQILNYLDVIDKVVEEYGFSDVGDVFDNYEVFYAYKNEDDKPTVNRDGRSEVIEDLCEIPTDHYAIRFGGSGEGINNTGFVIGVNQDGSFEPLIRSALHWGNVFQGIAGRRFNCFEEEKLDQLGS